MIITSGRVEPVRARDEGVDRKRIPITSAGRVLPVPTIAGTEKHSLAAYDEGGAAVVVTPVPALLSYCLMSAGSPTILPVIGFPLL
jgi:hypothetical protein